MSSACSVFLGEIVRGYRRPFEMIIFPPRTPRWNAISDICINYDNSYGINFSFTFSVEFLGAKMKGWEKR